MKVIPDYAACSFAEIARTMGISAESARQIYYGALRKLRHNSELAKLDEDYAANRCRRRDARAERAINRLMRGRAEETRYAD